MEYEATRSVNIPVVEFLELELHLMDKHPGVKPEAFVTELVKRWLSMEKERLGLQASGSPLRGLQWKRLFLPDGTILRTSHGNSVEFARVCGDRINSDDGATLTPSRFANRRVKGRNAWRFIWLRFPGHDGWVRADDCRAHCEGSHRNRSRNGNALSKTVRKEPADRSESVYELPRTCDFDPRQRSTR